MKNKFLTLFLLLLLLLLLTCLTGCSGKLTEWGKYLSENYNDAKISCEIYAEGERAYITIGDIEQVQQFYMLSGLDEQSAWEKAVQYVKEREALYQAAINNGYSVTDQEVWNYIEELKEIVYSADNKEDALAIIRQFDSEEDYWNYEFTVYQKNLPIQNYVHDMEQMFKQSRSFYADKDSSDIELEWQQYFEQMKTDLVNEENYQIINY